MPSWSRRSGRPRLCLAAGRTSRVPRPRTAAIRSGPWSAHGTGRQLPRRRLPPPSGLLPGVEDRERHDAGELVPGLIGWSGSGRTFRPAACRCGRRFRPGPGRLRGGPGAGGDPAVFRGGLAARTAWLAGALVCSLEQGADGLSDLPLGRIPAAGGQLPASVVPGQLAERRRGGGQVLPEHGDPAAVPVVADPDPGHVAGIAVDLPQVLLRGDARALSPERVQLLAVIDPVADLDAVGVDGPPGRGQQLDIVPGRQRDRDISGRLDQGRVLLVRRERPPRRGRVAQPVVRPVLPLVFTDRSARINPLTCCYS